MKMQLKKFIHTIRFKLIVIFIILFLIPFLLVETIIYKTIEERALINNNELMINNLQLVSDYTNTFLTDIQTDFQNIIFQEDFILSLFNIRDLANITTQYQLDATEKLSDDFEPYLENKRIESVYLYNINNDVFYDFAYLSPSYLVDDFQNTDWFNSYQTIYDERNQNFTNNWIMTHRIPNIIQKESLPIISYYTRLKSSSGHISILSVNVNVMQLVNVINSLTLPEDALIYIADSNGQIIASNADVTYGASLLSLYNMYPDNNQSLMVGEEKRHISSYTSELLGYYYLIDIPYSHITASANDSRMLLYGLYLALIVILLTMTALIQWFLLKPINAMIDKMRHVEQGNFDITLPDNRKDELGVLYRNFNEMTRNIHNLIEKNYVEVLLRKQSDLNYIQTQLNEHFLYNTLDAIYSLILNNDQLTAQELLLSLSKFFRTTLNNGKHIITIREIASMLDNYCKIMDVRNNGKFQINIHVDDDVMDCYALKFLFQPILENAIIHGVNTRRQGGRIDVDIHKSDGYILYTVFDNGRGIDDLELTRLNRMFNKITTETQDDFFALNNIAHQAKLFYRSNFSIHIDSQINEYTRCTVKVPILTNPPEEGVFNYDQSHTS